MRRKPIGTGPFKVVEFKPNDGIKLVKNPDYWKPGRPYLDGIECKIIPNRSTRILAFIAGEFDMTFAQDITVPLLKDIKAQAPNAHLRAATRPTRRASCWSTATRRRSTIAKIRRAMMLALDRKAFIDILSEGQDKIGGAMLPPPEGVWGMPPEQLADVPGYGRDVEKSREEGARDHARARLRAGQAAQDQGRRRATSRPIATRRSS